MSDWKVAMVCLLPVLAMGSPWRLFGFPVPSGRKLRTWAALFGAAVAAMFVPGLHIGPLVDGLPTYLNELPAYALIDTVAGMAVLNNPRGQTQRAIGTLFICMLASHITFFVACWLQPGAHNFQGYVELNRLFGWLQWSLLALWGGVDVLGSVIRGHGRGSYSLAAGEGIR